MGGQQGQPEHGLAARRAARIIGTGSLGGNRRRCPGPADAHGAPRLAEGRLAAAVCGGGAGLQPAIPHRDHRPAGGHDPRRSGRLGQLHGLRDGAARAGLRAVLPLGGAIGSPLTLVLGTALLSAAIAMGNVLLPALAKRRLPEHVNLVVAMMTAGMLVSSTLAASIAVPLARWQGWTWPLGIWMLTTGVALVPWLRIRQRHRAAAPAGSAPAASPPLNVWRIPAAWALSLYMGLQSLVFYAVVGFTPSVLQEKGLSAEQAGNLGALFQAVSLLGVVAVSWAPVRGRGRQWLSVGISLTVLAGSLGLWLGSTATQWLWVSLAGIGTAGVFSLCLILFAERTDSPAEAAALSGMAQAVGYGIAAIGPLGVGVLYDLLGSWTQTMGLLAALSLLECLLAWSSASPKTLAQTLADQRHGR
ncbi:MAG: MFS transporter [Lautropia mirabilis]|nr:MFS transporter [Lautropia mirabilis]